MSDMQAMISKEAYRIIHTLLYVKNEVVNNDYYLFHRLTALRIMVEKMPSNEELDTSMFVTLAGITTLESITDEKRQLIDQYYNYLMTGNKNGK